MKAAKFLVSVLATLFVAFPGSVSARVTSILYVEVPASARVETVKEAGGTVSQIRLDNGIVVRFSFYETGELRGYRFIRGTEEVAACLLFKSGTIEWESSHFSVSHDSDTWKVFLRGSFRR